MRNGANLKDTGLLDKISSDLVKNSDDINEGLKTALIVINKELENLWELKRKKIIFVEKCNVQLQTAQRNYMRCIQNSEDKNIRMSCIQEKREVEIARKNLQKAEEELRLVVKWKKRLDEAVSKYKNISHKLQSVNDKETPKAKAVINAKIRAIQAYLNSISYSSASEKGSNFETWVKDNYFQGKGKKKKVDLFLNLHLDKFGDGVGLTKDRYPDIFINENGEIWEIKSGYESGIIDQSQLREYRIMLDAGKVYEYQKDTEKIVEIPVNLVNYLFETRMGAENNCGIIDSDVLIWYVDENGYPELFNK